MEPPRDKHIRDPIHGMIGFNSLDWDIINSKPFQRLRRIRQLAWTDYVYPGATHTRFEHTLGVCHIATLLFDSIIRKDGDLLKTEYKLTSGVERQCQIIRLAALTHDLGHGPLSHAAEEALPINPKTKKQYTHEYYSSKVTEYLLRDLIEHHPINANYRIQFEEISDLFSGSSGSPNSVVWREIISGQMDADRMDYLLRDSYHCGVSYGRYDLDRIVNTVRLCEDEENECHVFGIDEDGLHAVEGLLIARFMMFTQVYFHKTRVAYDYHYEEAIRHLLRRSGGYFPLPRSMKQVSEYLSWDDWKVLYLIATEKENRHCRAIQERNHHRKVFWTPECPDDRDQEKFDRACEAPDGINFVVRDAKKSWYKYQQEEILIREQNGKSWRSVPLATRSPVVNGLRTVNQRRIYVSPSDRIEALTRLEGL